MKRNIICISGLGASGKTTIGNLLFERLTSVAMIDADWLFRAKPLEIIGKKTERLKMNNSCALIENYFAEGYKNIICTGWIWSQQELKNAAKNLKPHNACLYLFWLETSKQVRHRRAVRRNRDAADTPEWLETIEAKLQKIPKPTKHKDVTIASINTDNKKPEQVIDEILILLRA